MKSTVVALLLVPMIGLAGCGGGDSNPADDPPSKASDTSSPSPTQSSIITGADVPAIPEFKGIPAGIIADVKTEECTTEPGTVTAKGTVTNTAPGPDPRDIAISMSWSATGGGDVLARGVKRLPAVAAGATVAWSVRAELDSTVPVECVPTAQRGQFAGTG